MLTLSRSWKSIIWSWNLYPDIALGLCDLFSFFNTLCSIFTFSSKGLWLEPVAQGPGSSAGSNSQWCGANTPECAPLPAPPCQSWWNWKLHWWSKFAKSNAKVQLVSKLRHSCVESEENVFRFFPLPRVLLAWSLNAIFYLCLIWISELKALQTVHSEFAVSIWRNGELLVRI